MQHCRCNQRESGTVKLRYEIQGETEVSWGVRGIKMEDINEKSVLDSKREFKGDSEHFGI